MFVVVSDTSRCAPKCDRSSTAYEYGQCGEDTSSDVSRCTNVASSPVVGVLDEPPGRGAGEAVGRLHPGHAARPEPRPAHGDAGPDRPPLRQPHRGAHVEHRRGTDGCPPGHLRTLVVDLAGARGGGDDVGRRQCGIHGCQPSGARSRSTSSTRGASTGAPYVTTVGQDAGRRREGQDADDDAERGQGRDLRDPGPHAVGPVQHELDADEREDRGETVARGGAASPAPLRRRSRARAAPAGRRRSSRTRGTGRP